jgi:hypothetical protein
MLFFLKIPIIYIWFSIFKFKIYIYIEKMKISSNQFTLQNASNKNKFVRPYLHMYKKNYLIIYKQATSINFLLYLFYLYT